MQRYTRLIVLVIHLLFSVSSVSIASLPFCDYYIRSPEIGLKHVKGVK